MNSYLEDKGNSYSQKALSDTLERYDQCKYLLGGIFK